MQLDNAPYTVQECLAARAAFIASHVGGVPELIHSDDHRAVCLTDLCF